MDASVDGVKTQGLQNYRVQSPLFNFTYPTNNISGARAGSTQAVSDGYWVLLKPLPVGAHTIHMAGSVINYGALNFGNELTSHKGAVNSLMDIQSKYGSLPPDKKGLVESELKSNILILRIIDTAIKWCWTRPSPGQY